MGRKLIRQGWLHGLDKILVVLVVVNVHEYIVHDIAKKEEYIYMLRYIETIGTSRIYKYMFK